MARTPTQPRNTVKKRSAAPADAGPSIAARLRDLRRAAGLSQEAIGAQGFISTPGWIKVENGQRMPSEKLLAALTSFLVEEKIIRANQKEALHQELCALKYAADRKPFLAQLAKDRLATLAPVAILSRESAARQTK